MSLARTGLKRSSRTPFNEPIGPHRRVQWFKLDLAEAKRVKNLLGGTLNDVVLATLAVALRRYLARRGTDPGACQFHAAVPVSVRSANERGSAGNRVSAWLVPLPLGDPDPVRCFASVRASTGKLKEGNHAEGVAALTEAAEWTSANLLGVALRFINRTRPYNVIVTNVPGPATRFHLLDAPMISVYPHLPLFENQGLGVALFSYVGELSWGLTADWELLPDLPALSRAIDSSFRELARGAELLAASRQERPANSAHHPATTEASDRAAPLPLAPALADPSA